MSLQRKTCSACGCIELPSAGVRVDAARGVVTWPGGKVKLNPMGSRLLMALMEAPELTASRQIAARAMWGQRAHSNNGLNVQMHYLRRALTKAGCPLEIATEYQAGYRLVYRG